MATSGMDIRPLLSDLIERHPNVPELKFMVDDMDGIQITELSGGYANYTYLIKSRDGSQSVVIKHGQDRFKVFKDQNAPLRRRYIEYEMMKRMDAFKPGSCPKPYFLDMESNIIVMEDLSHMKMMHDFTNAGETDENAMRLYGELLSTLHWSTHRKNMTEEAWLELKQTFGMSDVQSAPMNFTLVKCIDPNDETVDLKDEMMRIAYYEFINDNILMEKFAWLRKLVDTEQCLIHPDNHQGSVFVGEDRCVMFDLELAGLSKPELNVAFFASMFVNSLHVRAPSEQKEAIRDRFRSANKVYLETYLKGIPDMEDQVTREEFISLTTYFQAAICFRIVTIPELTRILQNTHPTPARRATFVRHMASIIRRADGIRSVTDYLDAFFSDPKPQ